MEQACGYTYWAYVSYVDLESPDSFEYLRTSVCPGFYQDLNEAQSLIDKSNEYLVSAGFMQLVTDTISNYAGPSTEALVYNAMQPMDAYHLYTLAASLAESGLLSD